MTAASKEISRRHHVERPCGKLTEAELAALMRLGDNARILSEDIRDAVRDLAMFASMEDATRETEREFAPASGVT